MNYEFNYALCIMNYELKKAVRISPNDLCLVESLWFIV